MKHVFIINPAAGWKDNTETIIQNIKEHFQKEECDIYITKGENDARNYARDYMKDNRQPTCFYACGGDGTLNEIVNGVFGYSNAFITSYPSGSGNDFIKVFGKQEDFLNLENLKNGSPVKVDLIKIGDLFSINICNFGFDAKVTKHMNVFRRKAFLGKHSYKLAIGTALITKIQNHFVIKVDGKKVFDGKSLLCAVANGTTYGGGYRCAPLARTNDGSLDIVVIGKVSRLRLARLIKYYKDGTYINYAKFASILSYYRGKTVEIESKKMFQYTYDGEWAEANKVSISIVPQAISFIVPNILKANIKNTFPESN